MRTLELYDRTLQMPESWNELTARQLVAIAAILEKKQLELRDRLLLFKVCSGMGSYFFYQLAFLPKWLSEKMYWRKLETMLFIERNLFLLDFLTTTNTLTEPLLQQIRVPLFWKVPGFKKLYAPEKSFGNLTMEEFSYTEIYYLKYKEHGNIEDIKKLVAILYRSPKKGYNKTINAEGDVREKFNEHLVLHHAQALRSLSKNILLSVLYWYEGCRFELMQTFEKVYNGKESEMESFGMFSLMTNVAEDRVLGNFNELKLQYVHVVLLRLTELINKAEFMEAEHERQMEEMKKGR
jgi:hypothetical protein